MREPDSTIADTRLAVLYDVRDDDLSDLDAYVGLADTTNVIDHGWGIGSPVIRLAGAVREVPRRRPGASVK